MSYFHYTKGCHLRSIVKDGMIKTTNKGCEKKQKPAAWLTKSPVRYAACRIGKVLNYQEVVVGQIYSSDGVDLVIVNNDCMKKEVGICRILISEDLPTISWAKYKYVSGISEQLYYAIESVSRSKGNPTGQWLCTFNPIPKKYWEAIEMYVDYQWVRWDEKVPIAKFVEICLSCNN